jgi:uncharacterized RDD family membrane protein YckC
MTTPSDRAPGPSPEPQAAPARYWEAPKEEAGPAPGFKFAGHGARLVAYILDSLIVGLLFTIVALVGVGLVVATAPPGTFNSREMSREAIAALGLFGVIFLLGFLLVMAYFPFFWARSGQTPGMRPFGLYVVRDSDGGKISAGQAILRLIGLYVAAIPIYIGFVWIFVDPRRRGWHDLIAGTVVIQRAT